MIITTTISSMRVKPRSSLTPGVSVTRRTNMRPDALRSASIEPARVSEQADDGALKALALEGACGFESHPGHARARRQGRIAALACPWRAEGGMRRRMPSHG